jgi:hypothetical protein
MGKGSHRRPTKVDLEEFASSWERIFGDRSLKKAADLKRADRESRAADKQVDGDPS